VEPSSPTIQSFLAELNRRRVIRAIVAYGAIVFGVLQVADPVFAGLMLPDIAFRMVVIASIAGFPIVAVLAWIYELTAEGLRKTSDVPAGVKPRRAPVGRYLQAIGALTVVILLIVITAGAVGRMRYPASEDGRVGLAVFPFRTVGAAGQQWSEGAADLIATALDGTVSLRIVDPWSLWRRLRPDPGAAARTPDVEEATRFTEDAGAHRFLLGAVTPAGAGVEVTLRLYQVGRAEPLAAFTISAGRDDLATFARDAAVRTLARVWGSRRPPDVPAELDFDATSSPDALKAYLAAKEAMRRGMVDSANVAIDRAIVLDSTFVLALVEAVAIKSWGLSLRGQPYSGFFEILDRAEPFSAQLNERTRLRLQATRAAVRTDGKAAIEAAHRILEVDPLDYGAASSLAYYERAYGWQIATPPIDQRQFAEDVVRLDSTSMPALVARAWLAVSLGDTTDMRAQLVRIEQVDTSGPLGRNERRALHALLAPDSQFEAMLTGLAAQPAAGRITTVRYLRNAAIRRYPPYLAALRASRDPEAIGLARAEGMRLDIAHGRTSRVDSAIAHGAYAENDFFRTAQRFLVAADLAGVGDPAAARRAADALAAYVPADSAAALFERKPVWWTAWVLGAWNAQSGDTAVARRWIRAIGTLPPGGTSEDYIGSLQADIEARLASRRGDDRLALDRAKTAYALWTIHADNVGEAYPEPAMRLHLAMQYRMAGRADSARALLSSLVPPTTWMGFLTARASYELGELEQERGNVAAAAFHYSRAIAFWENGGSASAQWLTRTRGQLASLIPG
jgi:tetratricopeptide (TPR) repeat protein